MRRDMMAASRHLAFDLWRVGDLPAAIAALRDAFAASPPTAGAKIQLGTYLSEAGQTAAAIELLTQAVASEPTLDALNALGIAYARNGRGADALSTFARSLAIDPGNAMTFENIGAVHLDAGRLTDAKRAFEHAIASNADSSQGHAGLAMVAIRQGDRKTAIARWERAVALQPSNFDALYDLSVQLAQDGRPAEAKPLHGAVRPHRAARPVRQGHRQDDRGARTPAIRRNRYDKKKPQRPLRALRNTLSAKASNGEALAFLSFFGTRVVVRRCRPTRRVGIGNVRHLSVTRWLCG